MENSSYAPDLSPDQAIADRWTPEERDAGCVTNRLATSSKATSSEQLIASKGLISTLCDGRDGTLMTVGRTYANPTITYLMIVHTGIVNGGAELEY